MARVPSVLALLVAALLVVVQVPAGAQTGPPEATYTVPVDAPISEPFRLPQGRFGPGNRGLDYATTPGSPVRAANAGRVIFAGAVAGTLHVTVLHDDGLRTSYSFLRTVAVSQGSRVLQGDVVGVAGTLVHFGVRNHLDDYLDPATLLAGAVEPEVRLVPGLEEGANPLRERRSLADVVGEHVANGIVGLAELGAAGLDDLATLRHYLAEMTPVPHALRLADTIQRWRRQRATCTPAGFAPPSVDGRRILVLVAGIGSTSEAGVGVDDVDADALGYAPGDVVRFSYQGGRVPADGLSPGLAGVSASSYTAVDSQRDLAVEAELLAALLVEISQAEPGVPIDVVSHSQGGVVSRLGIGAAASQGLLPAEVQTFVTLGSPHQGSDLATAVGALTDLGGMGIESQAIAQSLGVELDPLSPSVRQLRETAPLIEQLEATPIPESVHFVSVAASGDVIVAAPRTVVEGEASATVALSGISAHSALPGSAGATREIALARAGLGPTCATLGQTLGDFFLGESISQAIDRLGLASSALRAVPQIPDR